MGVNRLLVCCFTPCPCADCVLCVAQWVRGTTRTASTSAWWPVRWVSRAEESWLDQFYSLQLRWQWYDAGDEDQEVWVCWLVCLCPGSEVPELWEVDSITPLFNQTIVEGPHAGLHGNSALTHYCRVPTHQTSEESLSCPGRLFVTLRRQLPELHLTFVDPAKDLFTTKCLVRKVIGLHVDIIILWEIYNLS